MSSAEAITRSMWVTEDPPAAYAKSARKNDDKPSIYSIVKAAKSKGIPSGTKEVLAQVCNITEYGDDHCWNGNVQTLAEKVGLSRPKVSLHLKRLVECGLLLVTDNGKRTKREYRPCPELVSAYQVGNTLEVAEVIRSTYHSVTKVRNTVLPSTYHSVTNNSKEQEVERVNKENSSVVTAELQKQVAALAADLGRAKRLLGEMRSRFQVERNTVQQLGLDLADVVEKNRGWEAWGQRKIKQVEQLKAELSKSETIATVPTKRTKPKATPQQISNRQAIIDIYWRWYPQYNRGLLPKTLTARDTAAALKIFDYLRKQPQVDTDESAHDTFLHILAQWDKVPTFNRGRMELHEIELSISNILPLLLLNGKAKPTTTASGIALTDTTALSHALRRSKELGLD